MFLKNHLFCDRFKNDLNKLYKKQIKTILGFLFEFKIGNKIINYVKK